MTDALAAMDAGADLSGFNFYPKSPRYIEVGKLAADIMSVDAEISDISHYVGVFVNSSVAEIHATMETCGLILPNSMEMKPLRCCSALDGKAFKAFRGVPESM